MFMEPIEYVYECPYCARHREICEDAVQELEYSLLDDDEIYETLNERSHREHKENQK
jgi:glutaredoxin